MYIVLNLLQIIKQLLCSKWLINIVLLLQSLSKELAQVDSKRDLMHGL